MASFDHQSRHERSNDTMRSQLKISVVVGSYFVGDISENDFYYKSIRQAVESSSDILKSEGIDVEIDLIMQDTISHRLTSRNVAAALDASSLLILDLSEGAVQPALYQIGYCDAAGIPHLILQRRESRQDSTQIDFFDNAIVYEDEAELSETLGGHLAVKVKEVLEGQRISPYDREYVWFPKRTEAVHVVASRSTDNLYSADPNHRNHVYLEQFSDKDSVLELMVFLSRNYDARIHKYTSEEFPEKQLLRDNLVVVGGPGIDDVLPGNPICRELTSKIRSRVSYAKDGESLTLQTRDGLQSKRSTYEDDVLLVDYGYFSRFPNPFEPTATVVMVHGLHTAGVLGACLAFCDHPHAAANFHTLRRALPGPPVNSVAFEALLEVERVGGSVVVPKLREDWIFSLEGHR